MISQRMSFITQLFKSCYIYNNVLICVHPYSPILTADWILQYCTYTSRSIPPHPHPHIHFPPLSPHSASAQSTIHTSYNGLFYCKTSPICCSCDCTIHIRILSFRPSVCSIPLSLQHLFNKEGGREASEVTDIQDTMYFLISLYPIDQFPVYSLWWRFRSDKNDIWCFWMVCSWFLFA